MKRYRVVSVDFDTRAMLLSQQAAETGDETSKELHQKNILAIERDLRSEFGEQAFESKKQDFIALGPKHVSIIAFHNHFFQQVRIAFVMGAYYPALTGACSLGERILNHLILKLRSSYKATPEYKRVYRKVSFDDWNLPIDVLESWNVLLPETAKAFRYLANERNKAVHFNPEVDTNARELALSAIKLLQAIIDHQFAGWGKAPWFFIIPGEIYIRQDWEEDPFVRIVYIPNCLQVSPYHRVVSAFPWKIEDKSELPAIRISDEEYSRLRGQFQKNAGERP